MSIKIRERSVGDGHPVLVVAEMAWAHDGSPENARVIIDAASNADADVINFHLTSIPDYMVTYYGASEGGVSAGKETSKVFEYLQSINLADADVKELVEYARSRGLLISTMCNDWPSLRFAKDQLDADMLMIHPSCVGEKAFLRAMLEVGKPLVIYIGGLKLVEIETAVELAREVGNDDVILQHGFQSYPTAVEDNHLRYIETLKRQFGFPVAFGDHTDGDDPLAMIVPIMGVACGANVIEKHITYDRDARGEDFESALGPAQFKLFVEQLRASESALGSPSWRPLSEREIKYRNIVRKRAVASRPIPAGTPVTEDSIVFKRCNEGLFPEEVESLLGRAAAKDIAEEEAITWDVLK